MLSEVCLYLYVDGIFNTLNGIWAWIWSFVLCSIAAMAFPYRRRELWQASAWNGSTLGIPNITWLGGLSTACLLFCQYWFWDDPIQGYRQLGHHAALGDGADHPVGDRGLRDRLRLQPAHRRAAGHGIRGNPARVKEET